MLMIDNIGFKYLFDQQNLNARQPRWLAFLSDFGFKIKHIKGKESKIVDALSKSMHHIHMTTIGNYDSNLKKQVKESLNNDEFYKKIVGNLKQEQNEKHNSNFTLT